MPPLGDLALTCIAQLIHLKALSLESAEQRDPRRTGLSILLRDSIGKGSTEEGQPLSSPVPGELSEGTRWWAGLRDQAGSLKILGQCVGPESTPPAFYHYPESLEREREREHEGSPALPLV